jgi:WXG100 family type VII secretion target
MAAKIEVNYEDLANLSTRFNQNLDCWHQYVQLLKTRLTRVYTTWEGKGAGSFEHEMEDLVLPAIHRLSKALHTGQDTCNKIGQSFHDAEEEAANLFKSDDVGSATHARFGNPDSLGQTGAGMQTKFGNARIFPKFGESGDAAQKFGPAAGGAFPKFSQGGDAVFPKFGAASGGISGAGLSDSAGSAFGAGSGVGTAAGSAVGGISGADLGGAIGTAAAGAGGAGLGGVAAGMPVGLGGAGAGIGIEGLDAKGPVGNLYGGGGAGIGIEGLDAQAPGNLSGGGGAGIGIEGLNAQAPGNLSGGSGIGADVGGMPAGTGSGDSNGEGAGMGIGMGIPPPQ